jgi:hypothetical protein
MTKCLPNCTLRGSCPLLPNTCALLRRNNLLQDWDDDNINDDFSHRLKAELAKQQQQGQGA